MVALCGGDDEDDDDDNDDNDDNDDDDNDGNDDDDDDDRARACRPTIGRRVGMFRGEGTLLRRRCRLESEKRSPARGLTRKRVARSRGAEKKRNEKGWKERKDVVCDKKEMEKKKRGVRANTAKKERKGRRASMERSNEG